MDPLISSPSLSFDEYQSILSKGTVFHELSEKVGNGVAFIQAVELKDRSIKDTTKEALADLAASLNSAQKALKNLDSKYCVRVLKEFCSEIQKIQAKILQSQSSHRRKNIKKVFNMYDLDFIKSAATDKVVVLTKFAPVTVSIKKMDAFCQNCRVNHASLSDFHYKTLEEYIIFAGKRLHKH